MKRLAGVMVVLCLMMFAVTCNAETEAQDTGKKVHKKEMHEKFKAERRKKLLKALDLDKETSAKLVAVLDSYDKKRHDAMKSMRDDIKGLREAVNNKKADDIKDLMGKIEDNHNALKATMESEKTEIKGILTQEQQAKLLLFMVDSRKQHWKSMSEKHGHKKAEEK
ncbi:hypothetical protein [Candidatus Magnetominusculus dajiuhuensis]|uniref:hypothetical protein n=1 Tax=Candidatus Magnetominusculus dajiuhuensis TaxID=3137712 RepID=UPI003B43669F